MSYEINKTAYKPKRNLRQEKEDKRKRESGRSYIPGATDPGMYQTTERAKGRPSKDNTPHTTSGALSQKAMKDLRFGTISMSTDPYTSATGSDDPYPLVAANNRIFDAGYKGVENVIGNTMAVIGDPNNKQLLEVYDAGYTEIVMNYLYTNRPGDASQAVNYQLGKAITESVALLDAELVRNLPFLDNDWVTDYTHLDSNNYTAVMIWYQAVIQNLIQSVQRYNTTIALEKKMLQMGFLREAPYIKELYSQLKKTTFREKVNNVGTNLTGEYIDVDWMKQVNGITAVPSRRADDKFNPLLTINATHYLPTVKEYLSSDTGHSSAIFDSTKITVKVSTDYFGSNIEYDARTLSRAIQEMMSPTTILSWARQCASGTSSMNTRQYIGDLDRLYDGMSKICVLASSYMGELRTILYRLALSTKTIAAATGIVKWKTGLGFAAGFAEDAPIVYNKLAADIFRGILCGPADITWNQEISAYTFFTLWNLYYGIPEFDKMSGGAFLGFSIRNTPPRAVGDNGTEARYLYPVFFTHEGKATFVNRKGVAVMFTREKLNASQITSNNKFARLQLGPYALANLNVPYYSWGNQQLSPLSVSFMTLVLLKVFGMSHQHRDDTLWVGTNVVDDFDMEQDIIGVVDMQQVSPANAMVTYIRSNAPLMVQYIPSETGSIGFNTGV
mgnify:CR=1 FL=1